MRIVPASVRSRVTAAATAAIVAVLVAVGWGLIVNHRRELTSSLDERMSEIVDGVTVELMTGEPPDVEQVAEEDWVVQVVAGSEVTVASPLIAGQPPLGPAPDGGQRTSSISPVPGSDDDRLRLLSRAVETPTGDVTIHVAAPTDDVDESVTTLRQSLQVAIPLAALALGLLTWLLVGRTLRPVERIRAGVAEIEGTDLHRRVPVPAADDEIGRLATTMNEMLTRVEHAQTRQRRFVADASHELRSPLTRMRTELEVDLEHPATADPEATRRSVLEEVVGLQQLVDDLLLLARRDGEAGALSGAARVDLGDVVVRVAQRSPRRDGVSVVVAAEAAAVTTGRAGELQRAVGNLLDNAIRHATSTVRVTVHGDSANVSVAVDDDGEGIPAADRERIFERFARVDAARSADAGGAGLGLSIARDIVERHRGTVVVDPTFEHGARFVITLPAAR